MKNQKGKFAVLTLHIGMPKTGTTTLQNYLGRLKPPSLSIPFAPPALCLLFGADAFCRDIEKRLNITSREKAIDSIRHDISVNAGASCLFSSEFLFSASIAGDPCKLREELSAWKDVRVILYLRHPESHFPSLMSQRVKSGQRSAEAIQRVPKTQYDYANICEKWSSCFDLSVVDFNRSKKNLVEGFCKISGLDYRPDLIVESKANTSLNSTSIELARRINELVKPHEFSQLRRKLIDDLGSEFGVSGGRIEAPEQTRELLAHIANEQNSRLVGRFLDKPLLR